jgi:tRNA A-37 threonylcarbamoyl transferase component Bud32
MSPRPVARERDQSQLIGKRLGAYLVEALIGEGAMGAVYAATDVHLGRHVALKVIHRRLLADETYCERFLREARAAARLNHPHIVQIYGAGTHEGVPYLALEHVDGGSVARYLRRAGGRLPARRALELCADAARGLGAAHAQGIVHRDVKPDNMLLDARGRVKLGDFGIARVGAGGEPYADRLTQSGYFVGTPRYSSPEQCRSEDVDGRSDLYGLGVCLYEMLAGEVPFTAKTPLALLQKICGEPPPSLAERVPGLPAGVEPICLRLLEKEAQDRYQTAEALLADLEPAICALPPAAVDLFEEAPAPGPAHEGGGGSPGSASPGRVSTEEVRRDLFGESPGGRGRPRSGPARGAPGAVERGPAEDARADAASAPVDEDEVATELARPGTGDRIVTLESTIGRLAAVERLATGGNPVAALRAAALVARDLGGRSGVSRALFAKPRRDALGRDPFYVALGKVLAVLRDRGTRFRPVQALADAVLEISALDPALALLAGELADLVEARRAAACGEGGGAAPEQQSGPGASRGAGVGSSGGAAPGSGQSAAAPARSRHVEALVRLTDLGVGLALPWKWDELPGAYDDALVPLDVEGRQQVQAAASVVMGLLAPEERERFKAWNARRRIVPIVSLENVGAIAGTSAGLPTLLAIAGSWLGLEPLVGAAATGAIDAATIPALPPDDRFSPASVARFLEVRIERVEAAREKARAALEQCPHVRLLLAPAANRADLEEDEALAAELRDAGVAIAWVETVRDALASGVFEVDLDGFVPREGEAGAAPDPRLEGIAEAAASLALAEVGAALAAAFAASAALGALAGR